MIVNVYSSFYLGLEVKLLEVKEVQGMERRTERSLCPAMASASTASVRPRTTLALSVERDTA